MMGYQWKKNTLATLCTALLSSCPLIAYSLKPRTLAIGVVNVLYARQKRSPSYNTHRETLFALKKTTLLAGHFTCTRIGHCAAYSDSDFTTEPLQSLCSGKYSIYYIGSRLSITSNCLARVFVTCFSTTKGKVPGSHDLAVR